MSSNILSQPHADEWLAQLPVHADGFGFIQHLNQETKTGAKEQPVSNPEEAMDLRRAVWEQAMVIRAQGGMSESAEPEPPRPLQ